MRNVWKLFRARSRLRGSYLTRTPDSETLSPGVFTPVLAKRSNPNRCHWPYVASRKLRPSAQEYVWLRCAELAPFADENFRIYVKTSRNFTAYVVTKFQLFWA